MSPTLLVLAAGMGSRYGGLKQIDPVGPSGETVLDYAVFDALRAGFGRIVFVIRREFEEPFRAAVGARYEARIPVAYAFQSISDLPAGFAAPAGRERPWGTGHAVWCARSELTGPFAVVNADDFYGAASMAALAAFLEPADAAQSVAETTGPGGASNFAPADASRFVTADVSTATVSVPPPPNRPIPRFAMVGFRLANTLSENGAVSRGVCRVADGLLESIEEVTGIQAADVGPGRRFSGEETVSMNCWGFTPDFLPGLDSGWAAFLRSRSTDLRAEFYLPGAVSDLIARGAASVRVLPTDSAWFGVTYREDKPRVQAAIAALVKLGVYPGTLF